MGGDFLEGWAIGTAIAYRAPSPQVAQHIPAPFTPSPGAIINEFQIDLNKAQQEAQDFRRYASRLKINLEARKMSESVLLKALKEENINHPLATEAGFEALFQKMIADQYGYSSSPENAYFD
jgi:hypothetical protein